MANSALDSAKRLLNACVTPDGFLASLEKTGNYANVWARDGCIAGLAALVATDADLVAAFERNLRTLARCQGDNGEIPSNVNVPKNRVSYGSVVGRVDSPIWFIIGVCVYSRVTGDVRLLRDLWEAMIRAHELLKAWEFNSGDLLYVPYCGDWADEYPLSGYLLYDQVLRYWAMRELAYAADSLRIPAVNYVNKSQAIKEKLTSLYLPEDTRPYYSAGFNPVESYDMFDSFGNALCCLLNIGPVDKQQLTLGYAASLSQYDMVPAFHPVISPEDTDYRKIVGAAIAAGKHEPRNLPGRYHNGGLWPFVNGFWVMAARKHAMSDMAARWERGIDESNALEDHSFFEFRDANTGCGGGMRWQAWSAAGKVLAQPAAVDLLIL